MDINATKAASLQQARSQLNYYTGKVVQDTEERSFQELLEAQKKLKIWDPKLGEAIQQGETQGEGAIWGYLNAVSNVQDYGQFEASAVYTALAASGVASTGTSSSASGNNSYEDYIQAAAAKYGVPAELIKAVIKTESNFKADAVSSAGAKGLMQLMDGTARGLGVSNSFDPQQNIDGGTKYLSMLLKKYNGNIDVALAAYNAGPGRIDSLGIATSDQLKEKFSSLPNETQRYIGKVVSAIG